MTTNDEMVTMRDIRGAGFCSSGARMFFKMHALDWPKFLKEGLPVTVFEPIEDFYAQQLVRFIRNGRRK